MLLFVLTNTITLCTIINVSIKITDLIVIQTTTNGIYLQAIEKANNIMISHQMNCKEILKFVIPKEIEIQLSTIKLHNVCLQSSENQTMKFYYFTKNNTIGIELIENYKRNWVELQGEFTEIPWLLMNHLQYDYNFVIAKQDLIHLCASFLTLTENFKVKIVQNCLHFTIKCVLFTGEKIFRNHALKPFALKNYFDKEFHSKYWIILKHALFMTKNIIISFNEENPVKIQIFHTFGVTEIFILSKDLYN